jgi:hypothetical protein
LWFRRSGKEIKVDLSVFPQLDDNPALQIKILFGGETSWGESGNNRFDNITLKGRFLSGNVSYYNKPEGSLNETSSWGSETDGSGQEPVSFDMPGAVYHIYNGDEVTISGDWAVSGILSRMVLGGGSDPVTFTIPPDYFCSGKMDISDNAALVLQNALMPEFREVSPLSTVAFVQLQPFAVPARSWGSLHLEGGREGIFGRLPGAGKLQGRRCRALV